MSLPLSRRIAQAAFVVAAGAVPAVLAGSASAATMIPSVPDLAGVSQPDSANLGGNLQSATHQTGQLAGSGASTAVGAAVPAVADATGATASKAIPATNDLTGSAAGQLGQVAGNPTGSLSGLTGGTTLNRSMPAPAAPAALSFPAVAPAPAAAPGSPLSSVPLAGSLPLNSLAGATGAAPTQRLGGLPGLGDTSGLTNGLSGVSGLTHGLPVGV